jgi:SagB-type dehydrogenase family enzyme
MAMKGIKTVPSSIAPAFENDDYSIVETFHEYSKLTRENSFAVGQRAWLANKDPNLRAMLGRSWKTYRGHPQIVLPAAHLPPITLEDALRQRKSRSSIPGAGFSGHSITLEELGGVLGMSYGVSRTRTVSPQEQHSFRMAASAGALYPLEIYPIVFRVTGLEEGIYHYSVVNHSLELVRRGPCHADFMRMTSYPDLCDGASVVLAITAIFQRNLWKYLNRGYRFVMNDAGALVQNLYLTGTAFKLSTCALGGFLDDELGDLLEVNNVDEVVIICFVLGRVDEA